MYVRLTRFQVRVERIEHALNIFRESLVPSIKTQKGYRGIYLFLNQKTGEGRVLGLYESEQDVIASDDNHFYQEQLLKFMNFFTAPPVREDYEVEFSDLNF
jgi:heme-degrading monooxygenase HmoA